MDREGVPRPLQGQYHSEQLQSVLQRCRADYETAKAALGDVGFICEGSLAQIRTCCRNPSCRCSDPARRHGPYWQLTWKEAGKTVSRRLSAEEARLYKEWIDNRRKLESVIREMQAVSRPDFGGLPPRRRTCTLLTWMFSRHEPGMPG